MTLGEAIEWGEQGKADRIAAPGKWKAWRDGDQVRHDVADTWPDWPVLCAGL